LLNNNKQAEANRVLAKNGFVNESTASADFVNNKLKSISVEVKNEPLEPTTSKANSLEPRGTLSRYFSKLYYLLALCALLEFLTLHRGVNSVHLMDITIRA